ncbi:choice-of-anchor Q domain-containing protein [Cyanobacterium aponinum AL20118]|uniref:Choice-of-anchor Q domain-containing protein n=1 Tax=Cyanobacterium aponinum AL20115 TaxID=3090662 RepID=A0AAF1C0D3_9CHRO|nr:choice-of-anchor Q domain-containing protein [Cyanobacterium aponinum]WPF87472.1 choice-of-anchor Q domain-containing protein [Cyanobacterium aponinum AL20115]
MTTTFNLSNREVLFVTTTQDENDGSFSGSGLSLRDAILIANRDNTKEYTIYIVPELLNDIEQFADSEPITFNLDVKNTIQPPTTDETTLDLDTLKESRKTTGDLDIAGRVSIIGAKINPDHPPSSLNPDNINPQNLLPEDSNRIVISAEGLKNTFEAFSSGGEDNPNPNLPSNLFTVGDRIFEVESGANLTLENLTIQDGLLINQTLISVEEGIISIGNIDTLPNGAGLYVNTGARAILNNVVVANNKTEGQGGGIYNDGIIEINNSLIKTNNSEPGFQEIVTERLDENGNPILDDNGEPIIDVDIIDTGSGGGLYNNGTMTVKNSSIIRNFITSGTPTDIAGAGAGIYNFTNATLLVINSTIAENDGGFDAGGGIYNQSRATVINSTIVDNTGQVGGGIFSDTINANTTLVNSIVLANKPKTLIEEEITTTSVFFNRTANFFDRNRNPIFSDENGNPINTNLQFDFYNGKVFFENPDPFAQQNLQDITNQINLDNVVFDEEGNIVFVFNNYFGLDEDNFFNQRFNSEDDNLVFNVDNNFTFAYRKNFNENIPLNSRFEEITNDQGETEKVLIISEDSIVSSNVTFDQDVFLIDTSGSFEFSTFDNRLRVDDDNKEQVFFVYGNNTATDVLNINEVRTFQEEVIETILVPVTNPGSPNDLDGFFDRSTRSNLIGINTANGILNNVNDNIFIGFVSNIDENGNLLQNGILFDNNDNPILVPFQQNEDTIAYIPADNSLAINAGNNNIIELQQFFSPNPIDQLGNPRINNGRVDIGSVESGYIDTQGVLTETDSLLNTPIFRFQNRDVAGTYLYAQEQEAQQIRSRYPNFIEEGQAFKVATSASDGLVRINRFQNTDTPGTYLFATESESVSIRQNHQNFKEEGVAFYVYGADADIGEDVYRFQSLKLPGSYLFALEGEKDSILANYSSDFRLEGVAFEVAI